MNDKINGKMRSRSVKALFLVSCMLVCAMSPVIMSLDDDNDVSASSMTLNYVSIGDSMVNGCGMENYYTDNGTVSNNYYGFEVVTKDQSGTYYQTYPGMLMDYLKGMGYDVTLNQLAISGLRSGEIRTLLDPGFTGDYYTRGELDGSIDNHILKATERLPGFGYEASVDGLRAYYADKISEADLISYQSHWDFGNDIGKTIMGLLSGNEYYSPEFDLYIDESILEMIVSVRAELTYAIEDMLSEQGISLEGYESKIHAIESLTNVAIYSVVSYCSNFDANMEAIFSMNPDVKVLVLDSYSNINGLKLIVGDMTIPLDDMFQVLLDISNLYTKYLSPYSHMTYHVDIDDTVDKLSDDFLKFDIDNIEETEISEDTKYLLMARVLDAPVTYDAITTPDRVETLFFQKVFNTTEINLGSLGSMDFNGLETKVATAIEMFGVYAAYNSAVCTLEDDGNGGCTISGFVRYNSSVMPYSVEFSQGELGLLQIYLTAYCEGAAIAHPSTSGHDAIISAIIDTIETQDVLNSEPKCNLFGNNVGTTVESGTVGTLVNLVDTLGLVSVDPSVIADYLGLELDDLGFPIGSRVDDLCYLLGGTEVSDAYTDALLGNAAANYGITVDELRQLYQIAVTNSSAVLVNAGGDNLIYTLTECFNIINGGEATPKDFTKFDSLNAEVVATISDIKMAISALMTNIFGADSEIVKNTAIVTDIVETVAYSMIGYADNYAKIIAAIQELNPEAQIIVIGAYNLFDGFVYQEDVYGMNIDVDIGAITGALTGQLNKFIEGQLVGIDNATFVDMTDIHQNDIPVNVAGFTSVDDLMAALPHMMLTEDEIIAQIGIIEDSISQVQYTITFDIDGIETSENYFFGEDIVIPDCEKTGYTFVGFDGEVPATMPACDLYFTAVYEVNTYTVTLGANGVAYDTLTFEYGEALDITAPTKIGYTFVAWDATIPATMPAEDLVFDATLVANTFTVVFDANGGEGTMASMTYTYDVTQALVDNGFAMENNEFIGWNTEADGSGDAFADGEIVGNLTAEDGATVTLYAQWSEISGPLSYEQTAQLVSYTILVLSIISIIGCLVALRKH